MESRSIDLDKKDGIARLTINRPPVNVLDFAAMAELNGILQDLSVDQETSVVLIRGKGTKAFCAGVEVRDHVGEKMPRMMEEFEKIFRLLRNLGKPSIAVVNGMALGGGCEIVAGCDMAIADEKAVLSQPEVTLGGLAPAAAALFPRIMGQKKALELILLGQTISAREAERIGLVNKVVTEAELDATAEAFARKCLEKSRLSMKLVRDAVYACADIADLGAALQTGTRLGITSWQTEDGQEGLKAFLEKRKPVWKQR